MKIKSILIILLSAFSLTAFAQPKKVAVYVTGKESGVNKVLGDQLVAAFSQSGKYVAIERTASFLAELGKEQDYQRTGAVSDNEISRLGKQFGVSLVCVADVSDVFGSKYVSARLIDVESAEVVNSSNANSSLANMDELLKVSKQITAELTAKTAQEKAEEQAAIQKEQEDLVKKLKKAEIDGYIQVDGLMFVVTKNIPKMNFYPAKNAAKKMTLGGFNDWRLPTITEISRIRDITMEYHRIYSSFPEYRGNFGCAYDQSVVSDGSSYGSWAGVTRQVVFVRSVKE